eukprot:m51a1_g5537 hypothetical protein (701) ;mRNA; f:462814-465997
MSSGQRVGAGDAAVNSRDLTAAFVSVRNHLRSADTETRAVADRLRTLRTMAVAGMTDAEKPAGAAEGQRCASCGASLGGALAGLLRRPHVCPCCRQALCAACCSARLPLDDAVEVASCARCASLAARIKARQKFAQAVKEASGIRLVALCAEIESTKTLASTRMERLERLVATCTNRQSPSHREALDYLVGVNDLHVKLQQSLTALGPPPQTGQQVDTLTKVLGNIRVSLAAYLADARPRVAVAEKRLNDAGKRAPPPSIASVTPAMAPVSGGTTLVVSGSNIDRGAVATVAGCQCRCEWKSAEEIAVTCPPSPDGRPGMASISVTNPDGGSDTAEAMLQFVPDTLLRAGPVQQQHRSILPPFSSWLSVTPPLGSQPTRPAPVPQELHRKAGPAPEICACVPAVLSPRGGSIKLLGQGFDSGATVMVGGAKATNCRASADGEELECTAPALKEGVHDLRVVNPGGSWAEMKGIVIYTPEMDSLPKAPPAGRSPSPRPLLASVSKRWRDACARVAPVEIRRSALTFDAENHGERACVSADGRSASRECPADTFYKAPLCVARQLPPHRCYFEVEVTICPHSWAGTLRMFFAEEPRNLTKVSDLAPMSVLEGAGLRTGDRVGLLRDWHGRALYFVNGVFFAVEKNQKPLPTAAPLYALVDVYGKTCAVRLVRPRRIPRGDYDYAPYNPESVASAAATQNLIN